MSIIERLKKEAEARIDEMYREKARDKKIEDKTFGRSQAKAWGTVYTSNFSR